MRGTRVEVPGDAELAERGFGTARNGSVELSLIEAAYLVDRGELQVVGDDGRTLSFEELVRMGPLTDPDFWAKLVVYTDLRARGLTARPIEGLPALLAERKAGDGEKRYFMVCVKEGIRLGFRELEAYIRRVHESKRELVLAIVDKDGNVSYYTVERSG